MLFKNRRLTFTILIFIFSMSAKSEVNIPRACARDFNDWQTATHRYWKKQSYGMLVGCLCGQGNENACNESNALIEKTWNEVRGLKAITGIMSQHNQRNINPDAFPGVPQGGSNSYGIGGGLSPDGR
jgi:hypothetical protein